MLIFIIFGFIFVLTLGYFFLMFFYPEWVGISRGDTKEVLEAQQEEKQLPHSDSTPEEGADFPHK